jgi:GNAT superfamily N-acetyltransferase
VHPDHQGKGIGAALLDVLIAGAEQAATGRSRRGSLRRTAPASPSTTEPAYASSEIGNASVSSTACGATLLPRTTQPPHLIGAARSRSSRFLHLLSASERAT